MRSRFAAVAMLMPAIVTLTGIQHSAASPTRRGSVPAAHLTLPGRPDSYLGVFETGMLQSYAPVEKFASTVGRQPNVLMYYSGWKNMFPAAFAARAHAHRASLLITMEPANISMSAIADGRWDSYLRSYARAVKAFGHSVIISFAPEMNGYWYSWGWTHTSPRAWVRAWRHVVTTFRKVGAYNVTWLWVVNQMSTGDGPIAEYWPGASYVTWDGIDGYYYHSNTTFDGIFANTIAAERRLSKKPIFIAETAIGQVAGQARRIPQLFAGIHQFGLLGFLWFDMKQQGTIFHQDWRLEGHPAAVAAFRLGLRRYFR